jgi:hypothetical protein
MHGSIGDSSIVVASNPIVVVVVVVALNFAVVISNFIKV